jgi:hypothetical protein
MEIAELIYAWPAEKISRRIWWSIYRMLCGIDPRHFMMFRAVALDDGRPAWLINSAVSRGDLSELLALLPFKLDAFAFHRHGQARLRIYNSKRMEGLIRRNDNG